MKISWVEHRSKEDVLRKVKRETEFAQSNSAKTRELDRMCCEEEVC